ncbi:MAG TPA: hypothetical protein VM103_01725 [Candidatus Paceibacterota bacterium]|nr:hypothetical protein [Candidatus Paceibacterota bacterium]
MNGLIGWIVLGLIPLVWYLWRKKPEVPNPPPPATGEVETVAAASPPQKSTWERLSSWFEESWKYGVPVFWIGFAVFFFVVYRLWTFPWQNPTVTDLGIYFQIHWFGCLLFGGALLVWAELRHHTMLRVALGLIAASAVVSMLAVSCSSDSTRTIAPVRTVPEVAPYSCAPFSAEKVQTCVLMAGLWSQWIATENSNMRHCTLYSDGRATMPREHSGTLRRFRSDTQIVMQYKLLPMSESCPEDHF